MSHFQRCLRTTWLLLAVLSILGAGPICMAGAPIQAQGAALLETAVVMEGLPPITAPGAVVPLHWVTSGGTWVDNTAVNWDTSGHAYDYLYAYRTSFQKNRPVGAFFDYIDVPQSAQTIYLRPWAVIDGVETWGSRQYTVPTWRAMDVGSASSGQDTLGRWWDADAEMVHHWFGLEGGTQRYINQPIGGTDMPWLYQRQRVGVESFACWLTEAVSAMTIDVSFYLSELEVLTAGQRVFDIVLEPGTTEEVVIRNVDIAAQAGLFNALVLNRQVTVRDYQLDVEFRPVVGQPVLSGISLRGVSGFPQREASQRVAYSEHDTYVVGGSNNWAADSLLLGGQDRHHGGLLFFELQVPEGAQINQAELWLTAAETSYQALNLTIYAEDVDSSTDFRTGSSVPLRQRTSAHVAWNVTDTWIAGRTYTSPDLTEVIQEVVNRAGWHNRNALTLLLIAEEPAQPGLPPRSVWSMEGNYAARGQLNVRYVPGDQAEDPTPAATLTYTPTPSRTPTATVTPTASVTPTPTSTATVSFELVLPLIMREMIKLE